MDKLHRRQAVRDYKERKVRAGIFAVRCAATGQAWIGHSRDLDQQQNGIWFALRLGGYPNPSLREAWAAHGEGAFAFEVLETIEDGLSPYGRETLLKTRGDHWRGVLGAGKIVG